ncbi:hypothetical protein HDU97_004213 [Phlyctochytrium planicorne]|nr:hypothetical protein HDU97_004213 [Phlyctochytrium planicorne]
MASEGNQPTDNQSRIREVVEKALNKHSQGSARLVGLGLGQDGSGKEVREDTVAIKLELAEVLGERGPEYWEKFGEFLAGRISRKDFNEVAGGILGKDYAGLHNRLIMAILSNVYREVDLPAGPRHMEFKPGKGRVASKRKPETEISHAEKKRLYRLGQIQTLDKGDRNRILAMKNIEKPKPVEEWSAESQLKSLPDEVRQDIEARLMDVTTCKKSSTLPTRDALKARMEIIAAMHGMTMDEDCVTFMEQSLITHLKDVITAIRQKVRFGMGEPDIALARDAFDRKQQQEKQAVPMVKVQHSESISGKTPLLSKGGGASIGNSPNRFANGLAPTADNLTRSAAGTPPLSQSLPTSPHLSNLKGKKGASTSNQQQSSSSSSTFTSKKLSRPTPVANIVATEDMLFSHEFTPALYTGLPGAFDIAEKMLGSLDYGNEDREPPHWRDIVKE